MIADHEQAKEKEKEENKGRRERLTARQNLLELQTDSDTEPIDPEIADKLRRAKDHLIKLFNKAMVIRERRNFGKNLLRKQEGLRVYREVLTRRLLLPARWTSTTFPTTNLNQNLLQNWMTTSLKS